MSVRVTVLVAVAPLLSVAVTVSVAVAVCTGGADASVKDVGAKRDHPFGQDWLMPELDRPVATSQPLTVTLSPSGSVAE